MKIVKQTITRTVQEYHITEYCCTKMGGAMADNIIHKIESTESKIKLNFKNFVGSSSLVFSKLETINFCPWCGEKIEVDE